MVFKLFLGYEYTHLYSLATQRFILLLIATFSPVTRFAGDLQRSPCLQIESLRYRGRYRTGGRNVTGGNMECVPQTRAKKPILARSAMQRGSSISGKGNPVAKSVFSRPASRKLLDNCSPLFSFYSISGQIFTLGSFMFLLVRWSKVDASELNVYS